MSGPPPAPPENEEVRAIVDPTSRLLREVEPVESRFPWTAIAVAALALLWLASMVRLGIEPMGPAETGWVQESLHPDEASPGGSSLARALTRATWAWQGLDLEAGHPLSPAERIGVRIPAAAAGGASLLIFFVLARLVSGGAAALLAACLLAISPAWIRAGTSALPWLAGEMMVLFGVTWALVLHGRTREVQTAAQNALRIGIAGAFLGIGLLLAPATFASFVTTLLLWFVLGLRRSSSEATTLPVESPRRTIAFAIIGTFVLVGATFLVARIAEELAGAHGPAIFPISSLVPDATLWTDLHRRLLSPGPRTDVLILVALGLIAAVRAAEQWGGRTWKKVGLVPWLYLATHIVVAGGEAAARPGYELPLTVTPLLMLGLGWTVLRGLQPGRVRRQEYGFALTWLSTSVLVAPFLAAGHPHDPVLAAAVSLLPPGFLIAARGGRALWEAADGTVARATVVAIAYFPIAFFALAIASGLMPAAVFLDTATAWLAREGRWVLAALAGIGAVWHAVHIRPERATAAPRDPSHPRGRRGRRNGRGGRGGRGGRQGHPGRRRRESGSRS